ncbi:nitroreductase family protein [Cohaesibacter intestini]|uniref:nitroreductase family protein n=1 Tax=Cohaesibacter intestini TaxID=2211145 RepID=UPI000DEA11DC|nr:nitroreductase family protein [Cohaesibacter intestini]
MTETEKYVPLDFHALDEGEMQRRADAFFDVMRTRRTVRDFSDRVVPRSIIETCVATAGRAPSGANQQPWTFVCISSPEIKKQIRLAAEEEERAFYGGRAGEEWLDALSHLGTNANKPFLEHAPWLIAIFGQRWGKQPDGSRKKHYYVPESVNIATGFLIAALHQAGLATLTHTPAPMNFLGEICERPENEKPYILLVVGYPEDGAKVPNITKKPLGKITSWL